jgi:hypothetical protein
MSLKKKGGFFQMKKIVSGIIALACATSMFAVDFAARVVMEGTVADGVIDINDKAQNEAQADSATKDSTLNFWNLSKKDQKDADALIMSVNGDKAGANFQFWYNYAGDDAALKVRTTNLWFKPIDMLKITVGDVSNKFYGETLDYWKSPDGMPAKDHATYSWSGFGTVEGAGILCEVTPISGLTAVAGITAGAGNNFAALAFNEVEDETYAAWGIGAKYDLTSLTGLPLNAGITYRDAGKDGVKIAAIGAEYGNRYGGGFYGMVNARLRFENFAYTKLDTSVGKIYTWNVDSALQGVAFDTMFRYASGAFNVMARFPVTIRGLVKDAESDGKKASDYGYEVVDPSWMSYEIKATYAIGAFSPYLDIENDNAVTFDDNFKESFLKMNVQPGVSFNVGTCAIDVGLKVTVPNEKGVNLAWAIPFNASVTF